MAHVSEDRVLETSTTTGTGALTLAGAVTGFRAFGSVMTSPSDTCWYAIWAVDGSGNATGDFEAGLGTYSGANTLTRTTVLESSNAGAAVSFAAGTKYVAIAALAQRTLQLDNNLAALFPAASAEPSTPAAGNLYLYAKEILPGWTTLKNMRPSGVDSPLQDALIFNRLQRWVPSNNTNIGIGAGILTFAGTATAVTISSGSAKSNAVRTQWASAATAGALTTVIQAANLNGGIYRGGHAGGGGFRAAIRIALNAMQAGNRGFWGRAASNTAATNIDPTTTAAPARVGIGFNANTGNWQLIRSDGTTAAATDLGANFPLNTSDLIELALFARPHDGTTAGDITYRVRRYTTSSASVANETTGTLTTNLPAATTLLYPWHFMTNNATAAAVSYHWCGEGQESDW